MAKISLAGFKDPVRRPRYIIWTGVVVLLLAAFVIVALGVTSSYWFCANACHAVQDDTITAYDNSSHSKISCMACHMPVNADPITFVLHKAKALGELYLTARGLYEIPLNGESEVALEFDQKNCTQCHSENREITASPGIIIDHKVHDENEVTCTLCHNRVAHNEEGIEFINVDPASDELNKGHVSFMSMTACFRCHGLEKDAKAPGACAKCNPADFQLKPSSHLAKDFYPVKHAEMAKDAMAEVKAAAGEGAEGEAPAEESKEGTESSSLGVEAAAASGGAENPWAEEMPKVEAVNYCSTCHLDTFCSNCHGMEMPHPASFKEPKKADDPAGHPALSKTKAAKCDLCHQTKKTNFLFCNNCHHGSASKWTYDPKVAWGTQHAKAVSKNGVTGCLEKCHQKKFCLDCHTAKKPVPTSHKAADWMRKPKDALGGHADSFKAQPDACAICHGENAPNKNKFCFDCHKLEVPHPQDFKKFHSKTGKAQPVVCANCHTFKELCSDCHHKGAVDGKPWISVHGGIVNTGGATSCFEKCHKQDYCVTCHTSRKVVPASHKANGWTRRAAIATPALHPAAFNKAADSCSYCHGAGTAKDNKFCMGCHKLEMPHPTGYGPPKDAKPVADNGGAHAQGFKDNKLNRAVCTNCHVQAACDSCHHQYTAAERWVIAHPTTVKKSGADGCFDCHKETFCSYCHVRQAAKILGN
ncbi:MAG: NapC/NirT family cytochrome c [Coriobacteriia bacterium]|nr:NapC/NirT family cytochrome c [Coriobacteriia bacterium]